MTERPDWVVCVRRGYMETWCNRTSSDFAFGDWAHAIGNAVRGGRLVACPDCVRSLVDLLTNTTEKP